MTFYEKGSLQGTPPTVVVKIFSVQIHFPIPGNSIHCFRKSKHCVVTNLIEKLMNDIDEATGGGSHPNFIV